MDFLQSVAKYYVNHRQQSDWNNICFVFVSHRAGVFFRKILQNILGDKVVVGLKIKTINEFFSEQSELTIADNLTLTFELYQSYIDVLGDVAPSTDFNFFYSWSSLFLGDFDDIDKYMVDASQIFTNTQNYAELSDDYTHLSDEQREAIERFWNITFKSSNDDDEFKNKFVDTYSRMTELYTAFRNSLRAKGLAYQGMLVRDIAEKYKEHQIEDSEMHYAFIGFNALTNAERIVFGRLRDAQRADFFWDYTEQMLNPILKDDEHGPGRFVRQFVNEFPCPNDYVLPRQIEKEQQNITITNFAYQQGQVAKIADIFSKEPRSSKHSFVDEKEQAERTAVVLTDENMLLPVISSLPKELDLVNITMGYPIRYSPVYGLVDLLARLHSKRYSKESENSLSFYNKSVIPILQHSLVSTVCGTEAQFFFDKIIKDNLIRIESKLFDNSEFLKLIFCRIADNNIVDYLRSIFKYIYDYLLLINADEYQRECVYGCLKIINRFGDLFATLQQEIRCRIESDIDLIFSMFISLLEGQNIDFCGKPLVGLQVMGILETRSVDFDNLVILDMNEGVFPKNSTSSTLIPYIIRKSFGLPTHEFQDSIYAYYFFRLISRAKNIELLYTSGDSQKGISRFLLQLKYEYQYKVDEYVGVHKFDSKIVSTPLSIAKNKQIMDCMEKLYAIEGKFMSPTAMINYIKCPLFFYYNNVLKIGNDDNEVIEEIDARNLGTIFHYVAQNIYQPNTVYTKELRQQILKNDKKIERLILDGFEMQLFARKEENLTHTLQLSDLQGRNIVDYNVIRNLITKILINDNDCTFRKAEEHLSIDFELSSGQHIKLGGIIDRQDEFDGDYRVIDYKTGKVGSINFNNINELFDTNKVDNNKAIYQTLIYCKLLVDSGKLDGNIYPTIYRMKNKVSEMISPIKYNKISKITYSEVSDDFNKLLLELLDNIFDINKPFECTNTCHCVSSTNKICMFYNLCYSSINK